MGYIECVHIILEYDTKSSGPYEKYDTILISNI